MSSAVDWNPFVRRHWERAPARLTLTKPLLPPQATFRNVIAACAPFRFGTRFRMLPDVRFHVEDGQLTGPGTLLPGEEDPSAGDYLRRAAGRLNGQDFELSIEQPFLLDFALWDATRGLLQGLLERVGVPVLPVGCELLLGRARRPPPDLARRGHHALLLLVLHGTLRVRVWEDAVDEVFDLRPGELLHVPSSHSHRLESLDDCLALRLGIPVQGGASTDAVRDVLLSMLEGRLEHDERVPYLPFTAAGQRVPFLEQTAETLHALTRDPDLPRALRIVWARRVSACALEPAPAPASLEPLRDDQRVRGRLQGNLIRVKEREGPWLWALHGHAFAGLGGTCGRRLLTALEETGPHSVASLCGLAKRGAARAELRAVLNRLHQLRGLEVVTGEEG